jgi:hypothetical protein
MLFLVGYKRRNRVNCSCGVGVGVGVYVCFLAVFVRERQFLMVNFQQISCTKPWLGALLQAATKGMNYIINFV